MRSVQGEFSWPEREDAKGKDVAGYHKFWRKSSRSSEAHEWEPFIDSISVAFGQDSLKAAIQKAEEAGVNKSLKTVPALYEYAVAHRDRPKKKIKVYLGKASNFQANQDDLLLENSDVAKEMWKFFRLALQHNCSIMRRYCYYSDSKMVTGRERKIDPQCLLDRAESRFLSAFDYPWNRQPGSDERGIYLTPHLALCCIPAGVDVIRIHPSMIQHS